MHRHCLIVDSDEASNALHITIDIHVLITQRFFGYNTTIVSAKLTPATNVRKERVAITIWGGSTQVKTITP